MGSEWETAYIEIQCAADIQAWPLRHVETGEPLAWPIVVAARDDDAARRCAILSVYHNAPRVNPVLTSAASLILSFAGDEES